MTGGEPYQIPANYNTYEKKQLWEIGKDKCGLYDFYSINNKTREQSYNSFINLYKSKLNVLNSKLAPQSHYKNFIKTMFENTLSYSLYIVKYECGDEFYQEIRKIFLILFQAIDYLVSHDGIEFIHDIISKEQFHKVIYNLKLLNFMKHIKQNKAFIDTYPKNIIEQLKSTFIYQIIILGKTKNIKQRVESVNNDFRKYNVKFSFNELENKIVSKNICLQRSWEALYELQIPIQMKEVIYERLKKLI